MSAKTYLLAGAAGLAALVGVASPAAAQYPGSGYGYGNNTNVISQVLGQVMGYGRYPYGNYGYNTYANQSTAVDQCARAVEARLSGYNGSNGYYGYGNVPYGGRYNGYNGYNNGYGFQNNWGQVRALQARINNVERQINRLDRRDRLLGNPLDAGRQLRR